MLESRKLKVVVVLNGGFGNQLFQLAYGLHCVKEEFPALELNPTLGNPRVDKMGNADIFAFKILGTDFQKSNLGSTLLSKKIFAFLLSRGHFADSKKYKLLVRLVTKTTEAYLAIRFREPVEILVAPDLGYFDRFTGGTPKLRLALGYFQSYKWLTPSTLSVMKTISLRSESETFRDLRERALAGNYLFVHIRMSDYKSEPSFGVLGASYYENAIDRFVKIGNYDGIWVFTDDPDDAKAKLPIELHELVYWVPNTLAASESWELMRFGGDYVLANSTYGWWAATLRWKLSAQVICPLPWFKSLKEPNFLVPPEWHRMQGDHGN